MSRMDRESIRFGNKIAKRLLKAERKRKEEEEERRKKRSRWRFAGCVFSKSPV